MKRKRKKLRVTARRKILKWRHKRAKGGWAHARKKSWTYKKKDIGKKGRGKRVVKIKRRGLLNDLTFRRYGKSYTQCSTKQRQSILRTLKKRGYSERQLLGMMQAQAVYRKRRKDHVKSKFVSDRTFIARELFP